MAVASEAYFSSLSQIQTNGQGQVVVLGRLLTTQYRIYHFAQAPSGVYELFHFGGREADWVIERLQGGTVLSNIEERRVIKTDQLINWLRHPSSSSSAAFLAKDPLAAAYFSLARGAELHTESEVNMDLYLIGREVFVRRSVRAV